MLEKRSFSVKSGNRMLRVWRHERGWRFGYREDGRWRYVTRRKKGDIVDAAHDVLREQETGLVWSALSREERERLEWVHRRVRSADEWSALRAWVTGRAASEDMAAAVARFLAWKEEEAGGPTRHLGQVRAALEALGQRFAGRRVSDVGAGELEEWWRQRGEGLGPKRRRDLRGMLVTFWKWARVQGLAVELVPERLPSPKVPKGERRVLSPGELAAVLNEVVPEFRAWVVLGAWAGLRPEEIAPAAATRRRGLHCEEIDWRFGVIRVPAEVAGKVDRPRVVPMCEALRAGLEWAGIGPGMTGPVVNGDPVRAAETRRLGRVVFGDGWPQDALRHSYGSYRNAVVRNLGQVAEEMGTSETMLHRHYHNPRAEAEGIQWFDGLALCAESGKWTIEGVPKSSEETTLNVTPYQNRPEQKARKA